MKKRILIFVLKTFFKNRFGNIDLSRLDLKGLNIDLSRIEAKNIYNNHQQAERIFNDYQNAKKISNYFQTAKIYIDDSFKQAKSIENDNQKLE